MGLQLREAINHPWVCLRRRLKRNGDETRCFGEKKKKNNLKYILEEFRLPKAGSFGKEPLSSPCRGCLNTPGMP